MIKLFCMKTSPHQALRRIAVELFILALVAGLAAGCATSAKKPAGPKFSFYPAPPDAPRLQFLTSFASSRDFPNSARDKFMTFLTGKTPGVIAIGKPYGGAAGQGKIYACDTASSAVMRLNLVDKKFDALIGVGPITFESPVNMAVDTNGALYIVDMGLNQLIVTDPSGDLVGTVGEKGKSKPMDVALTADRIYLSDITTHSVHVLDKATRTNLFDIPRPEDATNILRKLFQPINIAVDARSRLYVSDFGADRVQVYDADGKFLRTIGRRGDNYGEFTRPKGVAVDRDNIVYVVDAAGQMVQMFDDAGQLLMWFGEPNHAARVSLFLPSKVLMDYDDVALFQKYAAPDFKVEHLVIVMNQFGPMPVSVFGFGHKK
jgi:sugar lactone lactonase YvrE